MGRLRARVSSSGEAPGARGAGGARLLSEVLRVVAADLRDRQDLKVVAAREVKGDMHRPALLVARRPGEHDGHVRRLDAALGHSAVALDDLEGEFDLS